MSDPYTRDRRGTCNWSHATLPLIPSVGDTEASADASPRIASPPPIVRGVVAKDDEERPRESAGFIRSRSGDRVRPPAPLLAATALAC